MLATGNKSELAVGYSTLYGDSVGGFAPIKDVPKTWVWRLARWRNADAEARGETPPIPEASISKPPSAELRPGQLDTDSLPDYDVLDDILDDYVEQDRGSGELLAAGFDQELVEQVLRLIDRAEYKRRQYPPGPKISFKAFGRDRRLPITNRWQEHAPAPLTGVPHGTMKVSGDSVREPRGRPEARMSESTAPYGSGPAAAARRAAAPRKRVRVHHLRAMKERGERFAMLTSYDQLTAEIFDQAGIPVLLVGDSAANNVLGYETTLPVTVDELLPLVRAVSRGVALGAGRGRPAVRVVPGPRPSRRSRPRCGS